MKGTHPPEPLPRFPTLPEDETTPIVITGLSLADLISLNNHFALLRNRNMEAGHHHKSYFNLAEKLYAETKRELKRADREWEVKGEPIPPDQNTPGRKLTEMIAGAARNAEFVLSLLSPGASPDNLRQVADDLLQLGKILHEIADIKKSKKS